MTEQRTTQDILERLSVIEDKLENILKDTAGLAEWSAKTTKKVYDRTKMLSHFDSAIRGVDEWIRRANEFARETSEYVEETKRQFGYEHSLDTSPQGFFDRLDKAADDMEPSDD